MRSRRAGLSALFPRYPWQGARGGGAPSFLPRHVATAPTTFSCSAPHQGLAPVLMGGARGLKILHLKKGRDDWYKNIKGTHPGAEFPRGVTRIWPESWVHPSRGSLFPRIPEPRNGETVESFFKKIKLSDHASKFSSWEELFSTKTRGLRSKGIKKAKERRSILTWVERYRQGVDPGTTKYLLYYKKYKV